MSAMQAQISDLLRLQRYLVEGHLKLNDDRVAICREHLALCECLSQEGVVARSVLNSYMTAQKVSDQLNSCLHDPHIARLLVQGAGLKTTGYLSMASSTCRNHVLGCAFTGEWMDPTDFAEPWTKSLLSTFCGINQNGLEAPLVAPGIAHAFVSVAGVRITARLSMASRLYNSSLRVASHGVGGGRSQLVVKSSYLALRERRAALSIASFIGNIPACDLAAASWACKGSMSARFLGHSSASPRRQHMKVLKKGLSLPPLAKSVHSVLPLPRVSLAIVRCLGRGTAGISTSSCWPFACVYPVAFNLYNRKTSQIRRGRTCPPDPVYCSAGGHSGPSFANAIEFTGAKLPPPPLTLAARIRTSARACQVIAGWGSEDGCASAELRLKAGNLEYLERSGMWWGWKSVAAGGDIDLADGTWHGVAAVRLASGEVSLYADGMYIGGGTMSAAAPADLLATAKSAHLHRSWNGYAFNGEIGPLFIYDCALSFEQLCASGIFPVMAQRPAWENIHAELAHLRKPAQMAALDGSAPCLTSELGTFRQDLAFHQFRLGHSGVGSRLMEQNPSDSWSMAALPLAVMDAVQASDGFGKELKRRGSRGRGCL